MADALKPPAPAPEKLPPPNFYHTSTPGSIPFRAAVLKAVVICPLL